MVNLGTFSLVTSSHSGAHPDANIEWMYGVFFAQECIRVRDGEHVKPPVIVYDTEIVPKSSTAVSILGWGKYCEGPFLVTGEADADPRSLDVIISSEEAQSRIIHDDRYRVGIESQFFSMNLEAVRQHTLGNLVTGVDVGKVRFYWQIELLDAESRVTFTVRSKKGKEETFRAAGRVFADHNWSPNLSYLKAVTEGFRGWYWGLLRDPQGGHPIVFSRIDTGTLFGLGKRRVTKLAFLDGSYIHDDVDIKFRFNGKRAYAALSIGDLQSKIMYDAVHRVDDHARQGAFESKLRKIVETLTIGDGKKRYLAHDENGVYAYGESYRLFP